MIIIRSKSEIIKQNRNSKNQKSKILFSIPYGELKKVKLESLIFKIFQNLKRNRVKLKNRKTAII